MTKDKGDIIIANNDKLTFLVAILKYFDAMCEEYGWLADTTKNDYMNIYRNTIAPNIPDHNNKPIADLTEDDYRYTIEKIEEQKNCGRNKVKPGTFNTYKRLIRDAVYIVSNAIGTYKTASGILIYLTV